MSLNAFPNRNVLVTGANGMLGTAFAELLRRTAPGTVLHALGREELDVTDADAVGRLASIEPDLIIHCAATVDMDRCEREPEACRRSIVEGTAHIVTLAERTGARLVYPQSVFVFGHSAETPWTEAEPPVPNSMYGRAKLEAERLILAACVDALVIRMAGFFGGDARDKNFVGTFSRWLLAHVRSGGTRVEVGDRVWQPSFTEDLAANTLLLVSRGRSGTYHMASHGEATFFEVAQEIVRAFGLASQVELVQCPAAKWSCNEAAARPFRSVVDNKRLRDEALDRQRPWRDALSEYLARPYFRELIATTLAPGGCSAH